jgi:hypothetical protein
MLEVSSRKAEQGKIKKGPEKETGERLQVIKKDLSLSRISQYSVLLLLWMPLNLLLLR